MALENVSRNCRRLNILHCEITSGEIHVVTVFSFQFCLLFSVSRSLYFHVKTIKDLLFIFFCPFTTKSYHFYLKKLCNSLSANIKMLVTHCCLLVTRTIWVWLAEMSDLLGRHNTKEKTVTISIFKHWNNPGAESACNTLLKCQHLSVQKQGVFVTTSLRWAFLDMNFYKLHHNNIELYKKREKSASADKIKKAFSHELCGKALNISPIYWKEGNCTWIVYCLFPSKIPR